MLQIFLKAVVLFSLGLGLPAATGQATSLSGNAGLEQQVKDAERRWLNALYGVDMTTLESSESDDFRIITPGGASTKQQHLAALRPRVVGGTQPATQYSVTQQTVHIYGTIALVTEIQSVDSTAMNPPITSPGRYSQTEIWRNEGGTWKLVHLHMSLNAHHRM